MKFLSWKTEIGFTYKMFSSSLYYLLQSFKKFLQCTPNFLYNLKNCKTYDSLTHKKKILNWLYFVGLEFPQTQKWLAHKYKQICFYIIDYTFYIKNIFYMLTLTKTFLYIFFFFHFIKRFSFNGIFFFFWIVLFLSVAK